MAKVKHKFSSQKADGTDSTFVKPSNWNADHDLTQDTKAVLGALAAGPTGELPLVTSDAGDDGTIWTKAAIIEAIAAAVAAIPAPSLATGDISASVAWVKPGWLRMDGNTIGNVGSTAQFANASAHDLFVLFWGNIFNVSWPVQNPDGTPGRGASAEADWIALKKIPLPDARGRVLAMGDYAAGVLNLQNIGDKMGEATHALNQGEMPNHQHGIAIFNIGIGGGGGGSSMWAGAPNQYATGLTGGDGTQNPGPGFAHNNVQPTMAIIYHIKL